MQINDRYVAIKVQNSPREIDLNEVKALIERVAGETYKNAVVLELCEDCGFDCYKVFDRDGKVVILSSTGVGFASGFNAYLKERCGYSIGALSTSGSLPSIPPKVGEPLQAKSKFLYRYFFNWCTFSYTYAFDTWEEWEKTLDYLLLSGYNLILNPIGLESVWREVLLKLGYTEKEADGFLCGPAFYAWQWMMNMTAWAGGAPAWWYDWRRELAGKINRRLEAFGASPVAPGYAGMVPMDFAERFPNAKIIAQGPWCGFKRPSLLMPTDTLFNKVADLFYGELSRIDGSSSIHYYSVDPFHEGGVTAGIDLFDYGSRVYAKLAEHDPNAIWMLQGWTNSPKPDMVKAIPNDRVIVTNLSASRSSERAGIYGGAPWCYCEVFCFGGQYNFQGNAESFLLGPHDALASEGDNIIGMGYMPEGVNCNEIIYEISAYNGFHDKTDLEAFISYYLKMRYGSDSRQLADATRELCRKVLNGEQLISGESALCARPSLTVKNTSLWAKFPNPYTDQRVLVSYIEAMLSHYDELNGRLAYRKDLLEATRQAISNLSWYFVEQIKLAYATKNAEALSEYGDELLSLFDIQRAIVSTDEDMLLGKWLAKAKRHGKTKAERTYFEWNARVQITLWASREGAVQLRDYSAREWQGLLEDFYRPRWESFISRLEISLLTDSPLEQIEAYDEELPFVYQKKEYPLSPSGNLKDAVLSALNKLHSTKIDYKSEKEAQESFEEKVAKSL